MPHVSPGEGGGVSDDKCIMNNPIYIIQLSMSYLQFDKFSYGPVKVKGQRWHPT